VSSLPPGFPAQGIGDRDYFKVLRDRRIDGPLVSGPYRSKSDGNWVLSISRRLEKPDGSFDGVVVATVQVSTINDFYATFDKGPQGVVALLTLDGKMVVCHPDLQLAVGAGRHLNEVFSTRLPQEPVGSFAYTSTLDHVERLASYRKVKDYPLVVVVAPAMDEVLAKWRDDALIHLAVSLAVAVALGATGFALSRQVRRRQGAEKRLAALNRVLSVQANTDGLTGLANRRRFDEALAQQWRRMARHRAPLSLLLIDLDHFKLFNDTYGHPAGDRCLCAAARAIRSLTQRLDETAARYGGEEFALLLPKTGNAPAVHLAERIRVAIHALGIAHGSNRPTGVMTASVGVATLLPHVDWSSGGEGLLLQADAALYQAKLRGRNRVATAPEGPEPEMAEHDTPMAAFTLS
jgi:diguanylate cyclase (GGDEF)-like protein